MIIRAIAMTASVLLTFAGATAQEQVTRSASFVDSKGQANGNGEIIAGASGGVLIKVEITGLPPNQWVAFHVHETGQCDHTTGHESAGGHFNPASKEHGYMAASGPHAGDMPNQYVGADGAVRAEVFNPAVSLDESETGIAGRALMVHAKPDDYKSQPSGDAGERLACGVIK
jgi:superoxide dismutase, Cu-Zn family